MSLTYEPASEPLHISVKYPEVGGASSHVLLERCKPANGVAEVDNSCRPLKVPLFRGSSRFESLIPSHHNDDDDDTNAASLRRFYRKTNLGWKNLMQ